MELIEILKLIQPTEEKKRLWYDFSKEEQMIAESKNFLIEAV